MIAVCYMITPIVHQELIQFIGFELSSNLNVYTSLRLYRQLQILNRMYNQIQKNALVVLITLGTLGTSICLAFLISSFNGNDPQANILVFITYGLVVTHCLIAILLVLGDLVTISLNSEGYLAKGSKLESGKISREKRMWIKRFLKSCASFKISVWGEHLSRKVNFIEMSRFSIKFGRAMFADIEK